MLPVRGAREDVGWGWRGSSRSSRLAGRRVSLKDRRQIELEERATIIRINEVVILNLGTMVVVIVGICARRHGIWFGLAVKLKLFAITRFLIEAAF